MIRVLLVDDHPFVRASVSSLLRQAGGIEVVGECGDGAEVPELAVAICPDVVLMDLQMPRVDGIDATRALLAQKPDVRVLLLTGSADPSLLDEAARAGASGYVRKNGDPQMLVNGVRAVAGGASVWPAPAVGLFGTA